MADYLSPAVYAEELSSGVKPIEGVGTSTAGFVGHAEKGPVGVAIAVNNFGEFLRRFGSFIGNGWLAFAVKAFFNEGGTRCYIVRTCHYSGVPLAPQAGAASRTYATVSNAARNSLQVDAASAGAWGNALAVIVDLPNATEFRLRVVEDGAVVETYEHLTMDSNVVSTDPGQPSYVEARVNGTSERIKVTDLAGSSGIAVMANRRPAATTADADALAGGGDGLSGLVAADYIGDAATKNGLHAFDTVDDIAIVAVPDGSRSVHVGGMAYCENRQDCFYVADCQQTIVLADDVVDYKTADGAFGGGNAISSKYGALYAPWIDVLDPRNGGRISIPPSGAVAGRYAATDSTRGVHKAPAGVLDGVVASALGLQYSFVAAEQERLNSAGINLIRAFPGAGSVIWGARTVSADAEWRYLNVRRLFIFLRESILEGTTWVVFEPNDPTLWKSIVRNVSAFLLLQWRAGALVGVTPNQAFYVKCDAETNPIDSVKLGRVVTEIGVAPSKPAEFVIFRIQQFDGGASSSV